MFAKAFALISISLAAISAQSESTPVYNGPEYSLFSCKTLVNHEGVETVAVSTQTVTELFVENDVNVEANKRYVYSNAKGRFKQTRVSRYVVNRQDNQAMYQFAKDTCDFADAWEVDGFETRQLILCRDNVYLRRVLKGLVSENLKDSDTAPFTAKLVLGSEAKVLSDDEAEICRWMRSQ